MAVKIERALLKLQDVVKAHRKALVDVEPVDEGGQAVLNAVDTLLEIQELKLEESVRRLIAARKQREDDAYLARMEPAPPSRYRKH
jgi:hypothetical protein